MSENVIFKLDIFGEQVNKDYHDINNEVQTLYQTIEKVRSNLTNKLIKGIQNLNNRLEERPNIIDSNLHKRLLDTEIDLKNIEDVKTDLRSEIAEEKQNLMKDINLDVDNKISKVNSDINEIGLKFESKIDSEMDKLIEIISGDIDTKIQDVEENLRNELKPFNKLIDTTTVQGKYVLKKKDWLEFYLLLIKMTVLLRSN